MVLALGYYFQQFITRVASGVQISISNVLKLYTWSILPTSQYALTSLMQLFARAIRSFDF